MWTFFEELTQVLFSIGRDVGLFESGIHELHPAVARGLRD